MNEVATFLYKNKKYIYYLDNNRIKYGYFESNRINSVLSKYEIELMNYVLSKTIISNARKSHIKCGNIVFNNKNFKIMFDKISNLKFFYEIDDNKYLLPNKIDNMKLFKKYNDNTILYDSNSSCDIQDNELYYRLVALAKDAIKVEIKDISLSINSIINHQTFKNDISIYINESLNDCIFKNPYLTEEEKKVIYDNIDIIQSNKAYIDIELVKKNLSSLKVEYENDLSKGIDGFYSPYSNKITICCACCIGDTPEKVFIHELMHVFSNKNSSLGVGINEAITETIACEYCAISLLSERSYIKENLILYSLCEIIGFEPIIQYYFSGNINCILKELNKINNDEEKSIKFLSDIDTLCIENDNNQMLNTREIGQLFNLFARIKYNKDIKDIPLLNNYLYNNIFFEESNKSIENIECKGYFIDDYKKIYPAFMILENIIPPKHM